MQPALADVVQYFTFPGSTATAGARLSASRSFPSCVPPAARLAEVVRVRDRADDREDESRDARRVAAPRAAAQMQARQRRR